MARKKLDSRTALQPTELDYLVSVLNEYLTYNFVGTGSPEGVVTAPVGALYRRTDGGAGTTIYAKESGSGSTGWSGL